MLGAAAAGRRLAARSSRASRGRRTSRSAAPPPKYSDAVHFAVVHHTAGSNNYTRGESAAIVRGIEIYHVKGNGWNDIGYNFLVDKYGQVFEGRYGGVDKAVIGAHAEGFNTGSVGVAVLGSYGATQISGRGEGVARAGARVEARPRARRPALDADVAARAATRGSRAACPCSCARSPATATPASPTARATRCTRELPQIAKDVAALGGPKIYAPVALRSGEGQVRFTAQALRRAAVDGDDPQLGRRPGRAGHRHRHRRRLDVGRLCRAAGPLLVDDRVAERALCDRHARQRRRARGAEGDGVAGRRSRPARRRRSRTRSPRRRPSPRRSSRRPGRCSRRCSSRAKPAGAQTLRFTPPPGLLNGQLHARPRPRPPARRRRPPRSRSTVDDILTGVQPRPASSLSFTLTRAPFALAFQVLRGTTVVATPPVPRRARPADAHLGRAARRRRTRTRRDLHARAHDHRRSRRRSRERRRHARHDRAA